MLDASLALPDSLRPGLDIVFVGTAAGRVSAARGAYYAHPGNRFWRTLHEVGLTLSLVAPADFETLLDLGIGFTDVAKFASGMDHAIGRNDYDVPSLTAKLALHAPRAVAFTSKMAGSVWLGQPTRRLVLGRQPSAPDRTFEVFVLSSPSGAAVSHWTIEPWRELSAWHRVR
jgi:TDG/mug DNA glycosylase family protein